MGIQNYEPRFMRSTAEVISQCGKTLRQLHGKTLKGIYVLWNMTLDEWYKDAPVIVQVEDSQVELCANMNDLFSITFNQIDRSLDIEPMDLADIGVWHFEWRSISERGIVGRRINEIEVIEYEFRTTHPNSKKLLNGLGREASNWLYGLGFNLDRAYVGVFNALDENDITFHRTTTEEFHYIGI